MGQCGSVLEREPMRLLLLGPGGVGKSTLFRQIKLHQTDEGFSEEELKKGAFAIRGMLHRTLVRLARCNAVQNVLSDEAKDCEEELLDIMEQDLAEFGPSLEKLLAIVQNHWQTKAVRKVIKKLKGGKQHDSLLTSNEWIQHWLDDAARVLKPGFRPTNEDMIKLRRPTSGVQELAFNMKIDGHMSPFTLVDIGGQTHEMKTWEAELRRNLSGVVFMVSLADFNKRGESSTKLVDSFNLLNDLLKHTPTLQDLPMVVMMNKKDLFTERIQNGESFRAHVPQAPKTLEDAGGWGNADPNALPNKCIEWLGEQLEKTKAFITAPHGHITSFATCATDTTMAKSMIDRTVLAMMTQNLNDGGF